MKRCYSGLLAVSLLASSIDASWGCACPGERRIHTEALDAMRLSEIRQLRFDTSAKLYLTDAGFDGIRGITSPSDSYSLEVAYDPARCVFGLKDQEGRAGTLTLAMPKTVS